MDSSVPSSVPGYFRDIHFAILLPVVRVLPADDDAFSFPGNGEKGGAQELSIP